MMQYAILVCTMIFSAFVLAQVPPPPKPPVVAGQTGGTVCDITYTTNAETIDGYDVGSIYIFLPAVPMADVIDNHRRNRKVLDIASREQDRGGQYNVEFSEYRACEGGASVKITEGGALIAGMTLGGWTRITDETLRQLSGINERTKLRSKTLKSTDRDHTKAKKVKRNDLGQQIRD